MMRDMTEKQINFFAGPYLRCLFSVKEDENQVPNTTFKCGDNNCIEFSRKLTSNLMICYCNACGKAMNVVFKHKNNLIASVAEKGYLSILYRYSQHSAFNEVTELHRNFEIYSFPNWKIKEHWLALEITGKIPPRRFFHKSWELPFELSFDEINKDSEMAWLKEAYKEEIKDLELYYNEVVIDWKILAYEE